MGLIQSVLCTVTFCVERVLTWTCCAFLLILLMFTIIMLMVYGISVGYHYAQKELASFAMTSGSTTEAAEGGQRRAGGGEAAGRPVVRLVAVNRSAVEHAPLPILEVYKDQKPTENVFMDYSEPPIVILETERPPSAPELLPHEKELARKLIGRFRRSKNTTTTDVPFLRPYKEVMGYLPAVPG